MRLEKSIALSAACAASLMQERRRSCAKKRQCRIHPARGVEIPIDETVEVMAEIRSTDSASGVRITHDVERATAAQQMVELWLIGELVDPLKENARGISYRLLPGRAFHRWRARNLQESRRLARMPKPEGVSFRANTRLSRLDTFSAPC
jgi:hypothetical protein